MNREKYEEYLAQHYLSKREKWLIFHEEFEAEDIHLDIIMMPLLKLIKIFGYWLPWACQNIK